MLKKQMTIEDLAKMVKKGFDDTQEDINGVRKELKDTKQELKDDVKNLRQETKDGFKRVNARLDIIEGDIRDFVNRDEFEDLLARVKLVEKMMGLKI